MSRFLNYTVLVSLVSIVGCDAPRDSVSEDQTSAKAQKTYDQLWVTEQRAARYTCPSESCGVVGQLFFRESARIYEIQGEWARISKFYDASCSGGSSEYVNEGNSACSPENGIVDGEFAEWVKRAALGQDRPADPALTATLDEALVKDSDDFSQHRKVFIEAAARLIAEGTCTANDFRENGGWIKSTNHGSEPIYFMYCGGFRIQNRLYLDARTGRTFR